VAVAVATTIINNNCSNEENMANTDTHTHTHNKRVCQRAATKTKKREPEAPEAVRLGQKGEVVRGCLGLFGCDHDTRHKHDNNNCNNATTSLSRKTQLEQTNKHQKMSKNKIK